MKWCHVSSITQSCPTLCDPMNRSMPGLPVHHQLPEFTQTHVHRVSDAILPSHPLSSPSPPAPNPSQHQSFPMSLPLCMRWPKYWSFCFSIIPSKEHQGLISFRSMGESDKTNFIWFVLKVKRAKVYKILTDRMTTCTRKPSVSNYY